MDHFPLKARLKMADLFQMTFSFASINKRTSRFCGQTASAAHTEVIDWFRFNGASADYAVKLNSGDQSFNGLSVGKREKHFASFRTHSLA